MVGTHSFIFFDVGNTLIRARRPIPEIYGAVFAEQGARVSSEALRAVFRKVWAEMEALVEPGQDRYRIFPGGERGFWAHFVGRVVAGLGLQIDPEPAFRVLFERFRDPASWTLFDEVPGVLERLRANGVRLGVISNWDSRLGRLLAGLGIDRFFDPVVVSHLEGIEKPAPRIFHIAAERAGVAPSTCVHVGDSVRFDVEGAQAAGFRAVQVLRDGADRVIDLPARDASRPDGVTVISELGALPEIVRKWGVSEGSEGSEAPEAPDGSGPSEGSDRSEGSGAPDGSEA